MLTVFTLLLLTAVAAGRAAEESSRQEPWNAAQIPAATLYLELVVNDVPSGRVVRVDYLDGDYYVTAADLQAVGIPATVLSSEKVAVLQIQGIRAHYDSLNQQLRLTLPPAWFPTQSFRMPTGSNDRELANTSTGMLLNYELYGSTSTRGPQLSAWTEQRIFSRWGTVSNNMLQRVGSASPRGVLRQRTSWRYDDPKRLLAVEVGDLVTRRVPWSSTVHVGGFSISRSFEIQPEMITYPLPEFSGQAAVPTVLDLFINGNRVMHSDVAPGPFTVTAVPLINGAGEATVVTTNNLGQRTTQSASFYVASELLRPGLVDYSLSVGSMRRNYGIRSFSYGKPAASATMRYGVSEFLTASAHFEGGTNFAMAGGGADLRAGRLGVINVASAGSSQSQSGVQYSIGYAYTSRRYAIRFQRLQRSAAFVDLTGYDSLLRSGRFTLARRTDQISGAFTLAQVKGTLGAGYFDVVGADASRTRIVNISFSRPFIGHSSLHFTLNRSFTDSNETRAQVQVMIPIGKQQTVSASLSLDDRQHIGERVTYSRSVSSEGGLGYNVGYDRAASGDLKQMDVTWRDKRAEFQAGLFSSHGQHSGWGRITGTAIVMDGGMFPSNTVPDSFVLIDTDGYEGVPVRIENQFVGRTDRRGRLMVPRVTSYYSTKLEIDPLTLPSNVRVPVVERHVALPRQSGAVVSFPVQRVAAATIKLIDADGAPLSIGLRATHVESGQVTQVGWDGLVYFEELGTENHVAVALPDGRQCTVRFPMDQGSAHILRLGPFVCKPSE
jgi:outer membrane usher protein